MRANIFALTVFYSLFTIRCSMTSDYILWVDTGGYRRSEINSSNGKHTVVAVVCFATIRNIPGVKLVIYVAK